MPQQDTEQVQLEILPSYVLLLAMLNEFISALKVQLSLSEEDIQAFFSETYSVLKDTLLADTVIRQTLKRVYDHLDELNDTLTQIREAQTEVQQLEDNDIVLDYPVPDFDFANRDLAEKRKDLQMIIDFLEDLLQRQTNIDDDFAADCDELVQKISDNFKQQNIQISAEKIGVALIKAMNIIRKKIGLEDLLKRGEKVSDEAKQSIDTDYVRDQYTRELLSIIETNQ